MDKYTSCGAAAACGAGIGFVTFGVIGAAVGLVAGGAVGYVYGKDDKGEKKDESDKTTDPRS